MSRYLTAVALTEGGVLVVNVSSEAARASEEPKMAIAVRRLGETCFAAETRAKPVEEAARARLSVSAKVGAR